MSHLPWKLALALPAVFILYFFGVARVGLIGPDEPRYASIGREMAQSGDWVTPRLWGEPWFEKPALLYWMIGAAYRAGLDNDLAPRLPVACVSALFLIFFFLQMRREFGERAAWYSSAILATSAGWLAYSQIAVTDLPMSAAFAASMLLAMPWVRSGGRRGLLLAGAMLGIAVLAKGLVPLVLAIPLLWVGRRHWTDLRWMAAGCLLIAAPWYIVCAMQNGELFVREFFWKHHFQRFSTGDALLHGQPVWFYLPVLLAAVYPWTPLLAILWRPGDHHDARKQLLLFWLLFGLLFFSLAENKLPGYLLPLLPAFAALAGLHLAARRSALWLLPACALLLAAFPFIAGVLPQALLTGLGRAEVLAQPGWLAVPALAVALLCWRLERVDRRGIAIASLAAAIALHILYLKVAVLPDVDRVASSRPMWQQVASSSEPVCVGQIHRSWRYGLNFYAGHALPGCPEEGSFVRLLPGSTPRPVITE